MLTEEAKDRPFWLNDGDRYLWENFTLKNKQGSLVIYKYAIVLFQRPVTLLNYNQWFENVLGHPNKMFRFHRPPLERLGRSVG